MANTTADPANRQFETKKEFAEGRRVCTRTVEHWFSAGMPHLKIGPRKSLIETAPADAWLRERFSVGSISTYRPRIRATNPKAANPQPQVEEQGTTRR